MSAPVMGAPVSIANASTNMAIPILELAGDQLWELYGWESNEPDLINRERKRSHDSGK